MIASEEYTMDPAGQQGGALVARGTINGDYGGPDVMAGAVVMGATHFKQEMDPLMMDMTGVPGGAPEVQGVPEYPWMKEKKTSRKQHRGKLTNSLRTDLSIIVWFRLKSCSFYVSVSILTRSYTL